MKWNIVLNSVVDNKFARSENNPTKSGNYLCTCIKKPWRGRSVFRYLAMVYWDNEYKYWKDSLYAGGISHIVLAWTDEVKPCDLSEENFKVEFGEVFVNE